MRRHVTAVTIAGILILMTAGCAQSAPRGDATVTDATTESASPTPVVDVPDELDATVESEVPDPGDTPPNTTDCVLPIFSADHAQEMAPLFAAYEGREAPERFYGFEESLDPLGSSTAAVDFQNIYEAHSLGVSVTVANADVYFERFYSFPAFEAWQTGLGTEVTEIDAPGYTWAAETVTDAGWIEAQYTLVAGDRILDVTFADAPAPERMTGVAFPNVPASGAVAEGIRQVLCR